MPQVHAPAAPGSAASPTGFSIDTLEALFGGSRKGMAYCTLQYESGIPSACSVVYANPAFARITGVTDARDQRFTALFGEAGSDPALLRIFERVVMHGEAAQFERHHSVQDKWLLIAAHRPDPAHFIVFVSDVSSKRAAELELEHSEQRLRAIFESSPVPFCLNDGVGNIHFINSAFHRTFGYTAEDIPTLEHWWPLAYTDETYRKWVRQTWFTRIEAARAHNKPFETMEVVIRCKDGSERNVLADAVPLGDAFGDTHLIALYDITEQKKAMQSLAQAEQYAQRILDSVGEGLCQVNAKGEITFINPTGAHLLGYAPHEVLGKHAHRLFHHTRADGSPYPEELCSGHMSMRLGRPVSVNNEVFWRKDGTSFPVHYTAAPMFRDGKAIGEVLTFRDTTEETQVRRNLVENEVKLRKAQEIAGIGNYMLDLRTGLWESSPQLNAIFGIEDDYERSVEGWTRLIDPEFRQIAVDHLHLVLGGYCDFRLDYRITRVSDGTQRWVDGNGEVERDELGQPVRMIGTIQDITERKRIEFELQQSHDLLQKLSREIPGVLYQFQMHADGRFTAPFASEGAMDMFGLSPHQVLLDASSVFDVVVPEEREHFMQSVLESARTLKDWHQEFQVEIPGQGRRWRQGQAHPERTADGSVMWYGFVSDATERVQSRLQLQNLNETLESRVIERTRELAEALDAAELAKRSRGQFLANMSHEIRTPMNAVMGMVHMALKASPGPALRDYLEKIKLSGTHLLGIINDILDFSKIDAGKMELDPAPCALRPLLNHVFSLNESKALEKHLGFHMQVQPDVPAYIQCDALRLGQVLLNFLNNACKFTERGSVVLQVHNLVEPSATECKLRFEVQDTGIGLSGEQTQRLFQSFEQGDNSTTRKFGGTGLGLAISKQLVLLMHGDIGVDSTPGKGSTFWFTCRFDIVPPPVEEKVVNMSPDETVTGLRGKRILVVDDNEFNLEVACDLLRDMGMEVAVATNGALALESMQQARFDAVLMDVQMPVMDGHEATRRIRKDDALAATPVLAMTANAGAEDREMCLQAGMRDVITKPVDPDLLYKTLLHWVGVQSASPEATVPVVAPPAAAIDPALEQFAVWDSSALSRIVGDNVATQNRLLDKYLLTATETMQAIHTAAAQDDWVGACEMAHKLKSSSRSVGAMRLGALCESLERNGRTADTSVNQAQVAQISASFETVRQLITARQ